MCGAVQVPHHQSVHSCRSIVGLTFCLPLSAEAALLGKSLPELEDVAKQHSQPAYRGKQLRDGLLRGAATLDDFSNV